MAWRTAFLDRIEALSRVDGYREAKQFLIKPATRPTANNELTAKKVITAKEIEHGWRIRLKIAKSKGLTPIPGVEHLVGSLHRFPQNALFTCESYVNERVGIAYFWFSEDTGAPLGFIVGRWTALPTIEQLAEWGLNPIAP